MKKFLVFLAAAMASVIGHAQAPIPPVHLADWRSMIQQAQAPGTTTRQLSAEERALLRRQIQQSQPHGKS